MSTTPAPVHGADPNPFVREFSIGQIGRAPVPVSGTNGKPFERDLERVDRKPDGPASAHYQSCHCRPPVRPDHLTSGSQQVRSSANSLPLIGPTPKRRSERGTADVSTGSSALLLCVRERERHLSDAPTRLRPRGIGRRDSDIAFGRVGVRQARHIEGGPEADERGNGRRDSVTLFGRRSRRSSARRAARSRCG